MNVILCGMMGVGKTTVGNKIEEITGRKCYDTDALIVERYGEITDIFQTHGEAYFRALEGEIVKELAVKDNLVVSTGGGLVLRDENVALLKEKGKIIFLRAKIQTLEARLQADKSRPLLQNAISLQQRLQKLLKERTPVYQRVADYIVDVDEKTPEQLAEEIGRLMGEK